ncbi:unnamed protein product [Haemonchus placei]|uniref:Uncharacterized protein n=1 Tax=Haemonchus placei TaxID=6290 RepID=A0A0N4WQS5_HAEPC|nr:unnamed protein product [Haemonchus placei]
MLMTFRLITQVLQVLFGYPSDDAPTYSAVIAVILVHVLLCFWLFTASKEEDEERARKRTTRNLWRHSTRRRKAMKKVQPWGGKLEDWKLS